MSKEDNVRVVVRCRPLLPDLESNEENIVKIKDEQTIQLVNRQFTFDRVFNPESTDDDVYVKSAKHIVDCVLQGYNGTIFVYGQTGTGKTYTTSGIMTNSFEHIFNYIMSSKMNQKFLVRASYYEIYNEEIHDLLVNCQHHHRDGRSNKDKSSQKLTSGKPKSLTSGHKSSMRSLKPKSLELKEDSNGRIVIKDLSNFIVNNVNDLKLLREAGDRQRKFAATKMNQQSSRSHTIFTITIETEINSDNPELSSIRVGKFHLIDLAGSERQSKTGTTGIRLKEAAKINLSLTSLSLVIAALSDMNSGKSNNQQSIFIPYRNSKLTRILSDSLGGNSKTLLIACIGPAKMNQDETISTLRFASQTKQIKNKPVINEDSKDALLKRFEQQVEELRRQLQEYDGNNDTIDSSDANVTDQSATMKIVPNELLEKLRKLEEKICIGGENLIEKAELQEKLLQESERELQQYRLNEQRIQTKLEQKQAEIMAIEESYQSLSDEIHGLNRKLKKAINYLKESKSELDDMNYEHEKLRSELLDSIRISEKELKLTNLLINYYIPGEYQQIIEQNVNYNQTTGEWELYCLAFTGNNMRDDNLDTDIDDNIMMINGGGGDNQSNEFNTNGSTTMVKNINYDNIYLSYSNLNLT